MERDLMGGGNRAFDLNIERVLEDWSVADAMREVIANALDESALAGTDEPAIYHDAEGWHVRDWGRGLRYEHLTQNEDAEKLANPDTVIGKFGVGLKDALATFDRKRVKVLIRSRYADITTGKTTKHGFEEVTTLHAMIGPPSDPDFVGTDIVLSGRALTEKAVAEAKALFLRYSDDAVIGTSNYGQVLETSTGPARIYVNGLRVATEDNFLLSYNITSSTKKLRSALNRERSNVGRTAYSDRVKSILLGCEDVEVIDELVADLARYATGAQHDETRWKDVGVHACRQLNARRKVLFVTPYELSFAAEFVQRAREDGYDVVVVPDDVRMSLRELDDAAGNPIRDLDEYRREWDASFKFEFIDASDLTGDERAIWDALPQIFKARGGRPKRVRDVAISETMRLEEHGYREAVGLWDPVNGRIIVKRNQLGSVKAFAGTVLHEMAHALSGAPDIDAAFEEALTNEIGATVSGVVKTART
jgi:hypothetical protein